MWRFAVQKMINRITSVHLARFYPPRPCNYLLEQVPELLNLLHNQYGGDVKRFEDECIKRVATLMETLQQHGMPIYCYQYKDDNQIYVLVHLTEPKLPEMTPGEVVIWVGKNNPGTLSMRYARYVTMKDGVHLPKPHYEETKTRVQDKDLPRCLTKAYFSELRRKAENEGAERYTIMMRLFIAYNTTTKSMKGLDDNRILINRKRPKTKTLPRQSSSIQESGDDPAAQSTEAQELRKALEPFHNSAENDERSSSSPTGTEASNLPIPGHDGLTNDDSTDDSEAENVDQQPRDKSLEPEVKLIQEDPADSSEGDNVFLDSTEDHDNQQRKDKPRNPCAMKPQDGYVEPERAVGPRTNSGEVVTPPCALKPVGNDYV